MFILAVSIVTSRKCYNISMKIRDRVKRLTQYFSKTQRYVGSIALAQFAAASFILYLTPYGALLVPLIPALNLLLFSRLIVKRNFSYLLVKSLRSTFWWLMWCMYVFSMHVIQTIPLWMYLLLMVIGIAVYILLVVEDLRAEPRKLLDTILSLLFVLTSFNVAALLVAQWHWPVVLVMVLLWLVSYVVSLFWILEYSKSPQVLAGLWAFLVVELFWVVSRWLILYTVPHTPILISQIGLIVTALAYCWGGIYIHHKNKTLKRSLVFEYIVVASVVFLILVALSKWSVSI